MEDSVQPDPTKRKQFSFYADDDVATWLASLQFGLRAKVINQYLREGYTRHGQQTDASGLLQMTGPQTHRPTIHEWHTENVDLDSQNKLPGVLRRLEISGWEITSVMPHPKDIKLVVVARRPKPMELEDL